MKKKLFSLFLILCLILCLTLSVSAEEVGGSFQNCTWAYDTASGKLTISGTGSMGSFFSGGAPWDSYASQIRTVVIEPGVTSAGAYAFRKCTSLTSVTLPESLTIIDKYAFNGCAALTRITLPSGLLTIGEAAFDGSGLTALETPASLKSIELNAFRDCRSLISVSLSGTDLNIGSQAFYGCTSLMKLTIGSSVQKIGTYAFSNCTGLLNVTVPGTVAELGFNAFAYDTSLRSVTFEEGFTEIPTEAFNSCTNLETVSFPASLRSISGFAFLSCKKLDNVVVPEGVTYIGTEAFRNCVSMTSISLPSTLTSMGTSTFADCESLTHVTIPGSLTDLPARTFDSCGKLESVTLEEGIKTLGHSLFRHCASLKALEIPASVTSIDSELCYACESLEKVVFQSGTVSLGSLAFQHCSALKEVILPDTLQSIGGSAFEYCTSLKSITIPGSVTSMGNRVFGSSGLRSIRLESGMLQVSSWSVSEAKDLIYAVLPDTMVLVNEYGFNECDTLCHILITGPETEIVSNKGNAPYDESIKHFNAKGDEITIQEDCTSVFAYCSICDKAIYSETKDDPEHTFGDWELTTPPTTNRTGEETRTCTLCGEEETRTVAKLSADKNPFTDVPAGAYYEVPVIWAVDEDITTGTSDTTFSPQAISTRGQVVTFLWRCAGCPEPKTGLNPFDDVIKGKFYYKAVLWAVENGITNGTSDTTFSPMQDCTRGHVVTFLHRYLGTPEAGSTSNPFRDVTENRYFYDAVLWAVENGITNGTGANTFSPDNKCKRCEIVTFLYRALY